MVGTVFGLEWRRAARRRWYLRLRAAFLLLLLAEVCLLEYGVVRSLFEGQAHAVAVMVEGTQTLFYLLMWQQTIAIALLAPAMSAGSISDEKQRGTLDFLLAAPLSSVDIVVGKWLGQASQLFTLLCPVYPVFAMLAGMLGSSLTQVAAMLGVHLLLIGALVALGLLASVLARTTMWAVVSVYAFLIGTLALAYLNSLSIVGFDFTPSGDIGSWRQHVPTSTFLGSVIVLCLLLAILRLRSAHEQQRSNVGTVNVHDRRTMGDTPMRWKERYAAGWFVVPIWSRMPHWMRYALLMLATAALTMTPPADPERNVLVAVAFFALTSMWVGIRSAGAITAERERQTWDALIVTRLDARQIVRGKLWGNLDAVRPYMFAYLPVALVGAFMANGWIAALLLYLWCAAWKFMYFFAACGIHASARSTSTWQSLVRTLLQMFSNTLLAAALVTVPCFFCTSVFLGMVGVNAVLATVLAMAAPAAAVLLARTEELLQQTEHEWRILKETAGDFPEMPVAQDPRRLAASQSFDDRIMKVDDQGRG